MTGRTLALSPGRDFWGGDGETKDGKKGRGGGDEENRSYSKSLWAAEATPVFSPRLFLPGAIGVV